MWSMAGVLGDGSKGFHRGRKRILGVPKAWNSLVLW